MADVHHEAYGLYKQSGDILSAKFLRASQGPTLQGD